MMRLHHPPTPTHLHPRSSPCTSRAPDTQLPVHLRAPDMRASLLFALALCQLSAAAAAVQVTIGDVLNDVDREYASWNIDPSCNRGFHHIDYSNKNLAAAARGLSPSRMRFGGSGADALVYGLSANASECAGIPPAPAPPSPDCVYCTPGCLNGTHLDGIFSLARQAGADVIFGVSFSIHEACAAGATYNWSRGTGRQNAQNLMDGMKARGIKPFALEAGNEINNNNVEGAPCQFTPEMQAGFMSDLASMAAATLPGTLLVGPDTGGGAPLAWLEALLPMLPSHLLRAVTHHVYNGVDRRTWNSSKQLDNSAAEIAWYSNVTASLAPGVAVWAGENGPTGGGNDGTCGADSVCGNYASSLWYADDMATRARAGFASYQRQTLFGGAYGLTNSASGTMALATGEPLTLRPDYWQSFLWKRTLGQAILNASSSDASVRAYAFAGAPPSPWAATECRATSLLLLNLGATAADVALPPAPGGSAWAAWTLAPGSDGPFGLTATLNTVPLPTVVDLNGGGDAPFLQSITVAPMAGTVAGGVTLQPQSTTFLCYRD